MEDPHHVHVSGDARLTAILNAEIFRMASPLVPVIPGRLVGTGGEERNRDPVNQLWEGKLNTCTTVTFKISIVDFDFGYRKKQDLTLFLLGFLTNRTFWGADLPPLVIWLSEDIFNNFFYHGSSFG